MAKQTLNLEMNLMKKVTAIIMTTAMAVIFSTQLYSQDQGTAKAGNDSQKTTQQAKSASGNFVDKNKNGVCDNFEARGNTGHGKNFVDKNGDGKCDNCQGDCKGKGNGNCCGKGPGYQSGNQAGPGCCGRGQGHQHRDGCQGTNQAPEKSSTGAQEKK
jgi:hypothetical protein